jgi:hypothetical protein
MTHEELALALEVAQACLGEAGFDACLVDDDPMFLSVMIGGMHDDVMFTTSDSTSHFDIKSRQGDERQNYIAHLVWVVKKARADMHKAILEHYLE